MTEMVTVSEEVMIVTSQNLSRDIFSIVLSNLVTLLFIPIAAFTTLLILDYIGNKIKHRAFHAFAVVIALFSAAGLLFYRPISGSTTMSYLAPAVVMTAVIFILRFVKLTVLDYAVIFACFTCIARFVWHQTWWFGSALPILYVFIVILAIYKIRLKQLNGQLFHCWFATMLTVLEGYFVSILFNRYVRPIGLSFDSPFEKLIVWGLATLIIVAINFALIYAIKRLFGKHFREINEMGKVYPKIERFFIYNSAGILFLMMLFYFTYGLANGFFNVPSVVFNLFIAFALVIQLSFLIMVFRITWLKDNLQSKMLESQSLADYSSSLEKNMNDIRGIKHDIKNIFITMGSFVEQSSSAEMQDFFREKISPFVNEEISKSDLFGKLAYINNEPLKAFLCYKISQAVEREIAVDLEISSHFSASDVAVDLTDLVRILGILLDNAIEECMTLTQGVITIKLTQNDEMTSYMVKNTVSPKRKEMGIKAGVSSKDDGRGKGLVIVRGLLEKYDCVTLNSYFKEDCFVQSLVVCHLDSNETMK